MLHGIKTSEMTYDNQAARHEAQQPDPMFYYFSAFSDHPTTPPLARGGLVQKPRALNTVTKLPNLSPQLQS